MQKIILIFSVLCFSVLLSCTPSQRIVRIAEKYNLKQYETVVFRDTVYFPADTFYFQSKIDSTGYFYQLSDIASVTGQIKDSVLSICVITKADTVYIEKPIQIETIKVEKVKKVPLWFLLLFAGTVVCFWLFWVYRDKVNQ
jgi:hypothetical protein